MTRDKPKMRYQDTQTCYAIYWPSHEIRLGIYNFTEMMLEYKNHQSIQGCKKKKKE